MNNPGEGMVKTNILTSEDIIHKINKQKGQFF